MRRGCAMEQLSDRGTVVSRLGASGLSSGASEELAGLFVKSAGALAGISEAFALFVPGRIEVLGNHTDYAGGRSLISAMERGFCVVIAPRSDRAVRMTDVLIDEEIDFEISAGLEPVTGEWSNYPMTVARRIARNFGGGWRGADLAFASNLPMAAGLSSSSALIVAAFLALSRINDLDSSEQYRDNIASDEELAGYLGMVENGQSYRGLVGDRGVGTTGGCQDHTAILCTSAGEVSQFSYRPVRLERAVGWPDGYLFAIAVSGIVAPKTGLAMEKYNRSSRLMEIAVELWRDAAGRDDPHIAAALSSSGDAADRLGEIIRGSAHPEASPGELTDRLEHFMAVSQDIVPSAAAALAAGQVEVFGRLADRARILGGRLLKNTVPETEYLADSARERGAAAASPFGAGFGGSVWAMVEADSAEDFLNGWEQGYLERYPHLAVDADFFLTQPGPSALWLY